MLETIPKHVIEPINVIWHAERTKKKKIGNLTEMEHLGHQGINESLMLTRLLDE
jgi:hypothetical protein